MALLHYDWCISWFIPLVLKQFWATAMPFETNHITSNMGRILLYSAQVPMSTLDLVPCYLKHKRRLPPYIGISQHQMEYDKSINIYYWNQVGTLPHPSHPVSHGVRNQRGTILLLGDGVFPAILGQKTPGNLPGEWVVTAVVWDCSRRLMRWKKWKTSLGIEEEIKRGHVQLKRLLSQDLKGPCNPNTLNSKLHINVFSSITSVMIWLLLYVFMVDNVGRILRNLHTH